MNERASGARTLVGRGDELASLQRRLDALGQGHGALVLISGDAGIGKTSLALAFAERARASGALFAIGRCYERGVVPPFAPWHELLEHLQRTAQVDLDALPEPFGCGPAAQNSYQLMQAVVTVFRAASSDRPLVALLDDLHWADRDTLELLDFATRHLDHESLLVIGTFRPGDLQPHHPLYELLPQLQRDRPVEPMSLDELTESETARMVESRYGPCSLELAAYLHARSEGNPLFLAELLRDLVERKMLGRDQRGALLPPSAGAEVPAPLQQIVAQRVARLGADAETFLGTAAVVGVEWHLPLLEAVLRWPEEQLLRALELGLRARLVALADERTERYRFAHGLIREALYTRQVARRRKQLHAQIAAALESGDPRDIGAAGNPAALAYHFEAAGSTDKTIFYAMAAGDAARDRLAHHTALGFYQQARRAAESGATSGATEQAALPLSVRLAHTHLILNQLELAEAAFERMLELARAAGHRQAEGQALGWLSYVRTRLYRIDEARAAADEALRVAEKLDDTSLLAATYWHLGHVCKIDGDLDQAWARLREAERLARDGSETEVLGRCLQHLAQLAVWQGDYRQAEQLAREAIDRAMASRDPLVLVGAYFQLGLSLGEQGRYAAALEALKAGVRHAEESGERHYLVRLVNSIGWLHDEVGDPETALQWDLQALAASRERSEDGVTEPERYALLNLATDELHAGRMERAEAYLREIEPMLEHRHYGRFRYLNRYQLLQAEVALERAAFDDAIRWSDQAADLAASKDARKNLAKSHLLRGKALSRLNRLQEARSALEQAVALADELRHASLCWQARLRLGQRHQAMRRPADATEQFRQALDQVRTIAAELDDDRLRATFLASPLVCELRGAAASLEAPESRSVYPSGLTAREVEVLRLIAQGATNAAIAETLCISIKTANAHVTSILAKTGSANRAAAAAFALREGLDS